MAKRFKLTIEGIEDFQILPRQLASQAQPIVKDHAERAAARVRSAYPRGETGNLKAGVKVSRHATSDPALVDYFVTSTVIYAAAYEHGSKYHNRRAHPTFWPITYEERDASTDKIVEIVRAAGFKVTGGF